MDFSQLKRPPRNIKPLNPIEIFEKLPNLPGTPNDLWRGQTEALEQWHESRKKTDALIALNTGAGKTLVGLLIAQSLVNEGLENVTYLCGTIDLVYQTSREAEKLGIPCTLRVEQAFSNNLFETGKAFCITTYASMFNGFSALQKRFFPEAVIFDDAHVAERVIRDSFTLKITRNQLGLFNSIKSLFESHFQEMGKRGEFNLIVNGDSRGNSIMAAPSGIQERAERLYTMLKPLLEENNDKNLKDLKYPLNHLKDNLAHCAVVFADGAVEIAPPFLPTLSIPIFERSGVRRVYLSATLNYKSDIARAFGRIPELCIEPKNDAGNGERLVLFAGQIPEGKIDCEFVKKLSEKHKVLISVPSYEKAKDWKDVSEPPSVREFSNELQKFRDAESGVFILVSRVDGIDLPHDTCRVMILDELPTGASLLEQYQWEMLQMQNFRAARVSNQIVQLFGRINRGRNDYGAFIINGRNLNNWLMNDRYLSLLPELLRKQIRLGLELPETLLNPPTSTRFIDAISTALDRDKRWINFYGDSIENSEVEDEAFQRTKEIEERMANAALAESQFMSAIWEHDYVSGRRAIEESIEETKRADPKLAGWHNLWLGMCFELEGDRDAAQQEYLRARQRLGNQVILPKPISKSTPDVEALTQSKSDFEKLVEWIVGRVSQNSYHKEIVRIRTSTEKLNEPEATPFQHEEALRSLGEQLGFNSTRPDNEYNAGPDVLWIDEAQGKCIGFELKTGKKESPSYFKRDINEGLGHLTWISSSYSNYQCLGLIFSGPKGKCDEQASPSPNMYHCELSVIASIRDLLIAGIEDLRRATPSERSKKVAAFCSESQWTIDGLFSELSTKTVLSMKSVEQ